MHKRALSIIFWMLLPALLAAAAPPLVFKHPVHPLATVWEPIFADDLQTVTIPLKRAGNLLIMEAQVDSIAGNFVLDTGAPYLVLNATYFRDMPHLRDQEAEGINGNAGSTFRTEVNNFMLGLDVQYKKIRADVCDLSAIENSKKIKILGVLGTQLFKKMAITVDLFHNVLYLHKLNNKGEIPSEQRIYQNPDMRTDFKFMNDAIYIKGIVADKPLWFVFDTGAESNLLSHDAPRTVLKSMRTINTSVIVGASKSKSEMIYANFDKLTIGNYQFTNNRIFITNLSHLGKAYGYSMDAILGYDFFARGVFTINFVKKELEMYIYNHDNPHGAL